MMQLYKYTSDNLQLPRPGSPSSPFPFYLDSNISTDSMPETKYFHKGLTLSAKSEPAGQEFPAKLAYWTFGSPSNPAVLMPTCFGGDLEGTLSFLYSNKNGNADPPFPPEKYFVIVVGLMGGGESSSPSNQPAPFDGKCLLVLI